MLEIANVSLRRLNRFESDVVDVIAGNRVPIKIIINFVFLISMKNHIHLLFYSAKKLVKFVRINKFKIVKIDLK